MNEEELLRLVTSIDDNDFEIISFNGAEVDGQQEFMSSYVTSNDQTSEATCDSKIATTSNASFSRQEFDVCLLFNSSMLNSLVFNLSRLS
jgi:hypothetical protein